VASEPYHRARTTGRRRWSSLATIPVVRRTVEANEGGREQWVVVGVLLVCWQAGGCHARSGSDGGRRRHVGLLPTAVTWPSERRCDLVGERRSRRSGVAVKGQDAIGHSASKERSGADRGDAAPDREGGLGDLGHRSQRVHARTTLPRIVFGYPGMIGNPSIKNRAQQQHKDILSLHSRTITKP
jgi:hypothetical protein